jgi:hypothetical protein
MCHPKTLFIKVPQRLELVSIVRLGHPDLLLRFEFCGTLLFGLGLMNRKYTILSFFELFKYLGHFSESL